MFAGAANPNPAGEAVKGESVIATFATNEATWRWLDPQGSVSASGLSAWLGCAGLLGRNLDHRCDTKKQCDER